MKRAAIWRAVSSLPQAKKISLEDQLGQGLAVVQRHSLHLVADLEVHGESRSIILFEDACERIEAYSRLKGLIDDRAIDVLIYLDVSRLGRMAALVLAIAELCTRAGILLYELDNPPASLEFKAPDYDQLLMRAIKATGAQNDVRKINEKHRTGMIGRVMAGMFPSKPNYGYVEVFKLTGEFDHYETEQNKIDVVLRIICLYLEKGLGHRVIADMLNRDGVAAPDGGQWGYGSVAFILRHVWQYAGFGELNRRNPSGRAYLRHPGLWPAVIGEETARRVLAEMESRDKSPRSVSNTYRFSRMLICHVCGSPMSVNRMSVKGYTYTYYRCDGNHSRIREHEVAAELRRHVIWLQDIAHREQLVADVDVISTASIMAEMERYQAAIDKAQAGIKRADDDHYIHGRLDSERYASIVSSAQRAIAGAQAEITKLQDKLHEAEKAATLAAQLETIQEYGLEYLDMEDVREANAWLHAHFRVYVDGKTVAAIDNF